MLDLPDLYPPGKEHEGTIGDILEKGFVHRRIGNVRDRFECYAIALQNGFLSIDEVRRLENMPKQKDEEK